MFLRRPNLVGRMILLVSYFLKCLKFTKSLWNAISVSYNTRLSARLLHEKDNSLFRNLAAAKLVSTTEIIIIVDQSVVG